MTTGQASLKVLEIGGENVADFIPTVNITISHIRARQIGGSKPLD